MKKWLIALLGIFMMCGTMLLSACDQEKATLSLSSESVSIQIHSDEAGSGQYVVSADVFGAGEYQLTASATGYDEYITVSTERVSATRTSIIITGVAENDSPSVVTVRVAPGNVEKYIYVDVYSQISALSAKTDATSVRSNYLVKGTTSALNLDALFNVEPAKANKDITWSLDGTFAGVSISGNQIEVNPTFAGESVKVKATAITGVSASVEIPVLDKIDENVGLKWSYSQNSSFEPIDSSYNQFTIVPNYEYDEKYRGYVVVDYSGDLEISGYALDSNGNPTDSVVVNRYGEYNGMPLFRVSTMQGKPNLNGDFTIGFKIGYANYDYAFDTLQSNPIYITAREKVNGIILSNTEYPNLEGTLQTLYTQYVDSSNATSHGKQFSVAITPSTVVDATNQYKIILSRTMAGGAIANGCPIEIWYRDTVNANRWTQIVMVEEGGNFVVGSADFPSATTLYIKASENLTVQSAEGLRLTFQSVDNPLVNTYFHLRLVKSVSLEDFVFENGDFKIDSSANAGDIVLKKQFTLKGQTTTDGLYIINNSNAVYFADTLQVISSDENSVTFEITLTLKPSSYGITTLDTYQIAHKNGLVSEKMAIDIFLPLKDVAVKHNTGENLSNSVTDEGYNAKTYLLTGEEVSSTQMGLSRLMLKNDTTTPLLYTYNSINGNYAEAKITVGFVDFVESDLVTLDIFKAMSSTPDGVVELIGKAQENINKSNIAYFTNDFSSVITKGVGYTYAVLFFEGKGVENVDANGNITLVKIILLESYVSPNSMNVSPDKDKNLTLYSTDSLASTDSELTRKTINISFANTNVTYTDITNVEFISGNPLMGKQSITGNTVTWADGRYSLSSVVVTSEGISFNIEVVGTFGELAFYDTLDVHYILRNDNYDKVYDIYTPITLTIKNAQRVESLKWKNADDEGLYFEVGDTNPQYIMVEALPESARNNNINYVITNSEGGLINKFLSVNDEVASNVLAVNLSNMVTTGMTGYIYLMPADAVYNNEIKYYYMDGEEEKTGSITDSMLGQYKDNILQITYYDFLVNEAYFKSNATDSEEISIVPFADILVKIKVNVADGRSFEHSYRIFDNDGFLAIKPDLYYTVMTSLDLTAEARASFASFGGGLQGKTADTTILISGASFAGVILESGTVRNITFAGNVTGDGFLAMTNNGLIQNVTIDTKGSFPSKLVVENYYGGGFVGSNYGKILNSNVLGLTISAPASVVGGIAGRNFGTIDGARVEFYNLAVEGEENVYQPNKFTGINVGAMVGVIEKGSKIKNSYAYSYAPIDQTVLVASSYAGAFAGEFSVASSKDDTSIDYSFAVVGATSPFNGYTQDSEYINLTNYYIGYYVEEEYHINYVVGYDSNPNFVASGEGYYEYVNNGNPHLLGLMQDKRVTSVSEFAVQTTTDANGLYKSVAVDTNKGIMFAYVVENGANDLTISEQNDLDGLNTISLATLLGMNEYNRNIVVSSSANGIVKVVGSSLVVIRTGDVTLTLSSKQDASIKKTIKVSVKYALSNMKVSWTSVGGQVNYVRENATLSIQKTRSRDFVVGYENPQVYLGTTAKIYQLKQNSITLKIINNPSTAEAVAFEKISENSFKLTTNDDSVLTNFTVSPTIFEDEALQSAIDGLFQRKFAVQPVDGVISFGVSGQSLPITPSTNTTVRVEIKTTDMADSVVPVISYNGETLKVSPNGANRFTYTLARDAEQGRAILDAIVEEVSSSNADGIYTFTYNVTFRVNDDYKADIAENMDFTVYFMSFSGNSSEEWNGKFTLSLTRQNFTNIDVQFKKVEYSQFKPSASGYVEVHYADDPIAVLAPGNSAIMQVNVNPAFAYFDHVDFSYSFGGESVLDAVNVEVVKPYGENGYVRRAVDGRIQMIGGKLRYTPTAEEKASGAIFYKLWINTSVAKDSQITLTATFAQSNGEVISYVNSYLTISYLTQPQVTIDGSDTAYIAKGSTAQIQIDVLADQSVDMISLDGNEVRGISLGALSQPVIDEVKGIKTYTATLSASVLAGSADNDMFYIQAQVSRELNGNKEYKTSIATAILVDFKVDADKVEISGINDDALTVWQGVPKAFGVEYTILPEEYIAVDEATQTEITNLKNAREQFLQKGYYPAVENAEDSAYLVNYKYNEETKVPEVQTLKDRLFYVIGNEYRSVFDESVDSPVMFEYDPVENKMIVTGTKSAGSVNLVLLTYISAGGFTATYEKFFTINVEVYFHPDLPLLISSASEFNALNAEGQANVTPKDYMLTNDIVLQNYTPFDTKAIRSLDGNGYTIFIKSFNTTPADTSTLNISLFTRVVKHTIDGKEVPTTLKNLRVNLYNGGQLKINTFKYKTINIAGLAIENEGVITNCEVVSFYSNSAAMGEVVAEEACIKHANPTGFNVTYLTGTNTTEQVFHDGNMDWSSDIAGFVLTNYGSITNSRVGGETITVMGDDKLINEKVSGYTYASTQQLDTFNIIGQGNIAGFVLTNSGGYVASSFVKNVDMENKSNSTKFYVAGFVGKNSSSILTSYVEGAPSDEHKLGEEYSAFAKEGSSIKSQMGYIAGFAYNNSGVMKDSYSNILIANSHEANKVYLASGFVYENEGTCENCYSASQILNSNFTQMNFSGVSAEGELLKSGTYLNCYFFNKAYESIDEINDSTTESRYNTGALLIPEPNNASYFYGFAIADGESDGIWKVDAENGISLIEANNISISHRYIQRVADTYQGITAEDDEGKYILPYATLIFVDSATEINTALGGEYNPILILNAQDLLDVTGLSQSSYIKEHFNSTSIWGNYRIVNNIDLGTIATGDNTVYLPSSNKSFAGALYGNGFTISGISMTSDETDVAFGLFASIQPKGKHNPIITNINLQIQQVIAGDTALVGGLAGYIKDAKLINIQIAFGDDASVKGLNFAGGLAGLGFGNNVLKNIVIQNPTIVADRYSIDTTNDYFTTDSIKTFRTNLKNNLNYNTTKDSYFFSSISNLSYAGGMMGFVDNYAFDLPEYDFAQKDNFSINNVRVTGEVDIQGQVVGGVFGLIGYQTNIRDVGLVVAGNSTTNNSHILSTKYFAGGIAGQSFGAISRTFASHEEEVQDKIEDNMSNYYGGDSAVERGILDLFYIKGTNYTQEYIGGLVGYIGSGSMEISYSKLNTTSPNAQFAGGIVGGMELSSASTYQGDSNLCLEPVFTKFFFNEVYATGDVRANEMAGGVIGVIKGEGSRVALMAVNAFNYFTTYDYANETYLSLNEGQSNVSNNFRINSLVGKFKKFESGQWIDKILTTTTLQEYTDYLIPVIAFEEQQQEGGALTSAEIPSVAVYEDYNFGGLQVEMDLFPVEKQDSSANPTFDTLRGNNTIYVITRASEYTNSTVGHSYTQEGFLNSGSWSHANWGHEMNDLFPEIKYKRSIDVLYLDCYNVESVFRQMSGTGTRVIVRGLVSEGAEEYADVDLDQYFKEYGTDAFEKGNEYPIFIESFSGRLEGGAYKTSASNGRDDVKIIASQNFIKSTGAGFYTDGVTVEYKSYGTGATPTIALDGTDGTAGLFIKSEVVESTIANLHLILDNQVVVKVNNEASANVGLIAPKLTSTSVRSIKISTPNALREYMMSVTSNTGVATASIEEEEKTLNVGLIAGTLAQDSRISIMQISGITIETKADLISMSGIAVDNVNVGGYFGRTQKLAEAQDLRVNISQIVKKTESPTQDFGQVGITDVTSTNIMVGGYIGKAEGISAIATQDGKEINTSIEFLFTGANHFTNFYTGGVIGRSIVASPLSIVGQSSKIESVVLMADTSVVDGEFAVGGFSAKMDGKVSLSSFDTINLTLGAYNTTHALQKPNQETFENDYMLSGGVNVKANTYIGIVVGYAGGAFDMQGGLSANTNLNADNQPINVVAQDSAKVYFGSVLGYTNAERVVREDETSLNNSGYVSTTTRLTGKVLSRAQVAIQSAGNADIIAGGMVGCIEGQSSADATYMADVRIGNENTSTMLRYDGAIYSNAQKLIAGGIIGSFTTSRDDTLFSIENSSFGGALKVYGTNSQNADVTFGGSVGRYTITGTTAKVSIKNNYNYGDVFVEYSDTLNTLNSYTFGGIAGHISSPCEKEDIVGNYSLTTNHNARHSSINSSANALYGSGAIDALGTAFNYYSHAVTLCTDYLGVDIGYDEAYSLAGIGYNGKHTSLNTTYSTSILNKNTLGLAEEPIAGHKLNPQPVGTNGELAVEDIASFNGITYYTIANSLSNGSLHYEGTENFALNNVALVGNGNTINYTLQQESDVGSCYGYVKELAGFSYISGFAMNANMVIENGENDKAYAPLVGTMKDNTSVYAINVYGEFALGGVNETSTPIQSGLVGQVLAGKIFDCSTDIDLVYRAGIVRDGTPKSGSVYGIAKITTEEANIFNSKLVERCYSAGSIQTMIKANVYGITDGSLDAVIKNCYTISKVDCNDYTQEIDEAGEVYVVKGVSSQPAEEVANIFYDIDGLNYIGLGEDDKASGKKYSQMTTNIFGEKDPFANEEIWLADKDFNYGYPTLRYGYAKRSSWATREGATRGEGYDAYIEDGTFTRLSNGTKPATIGENTFFMLPNVGVLANMVNISGAPQGEGEPNTIITGNFALLYDIDWTQRTANSEGFEPYIFKGRFDGREKTITALKEHLFTSVGDTSTSKDSTWVRNVRFTDVGSDIKNILADTIQIATVSNLTLSGVIKTSTAKNIGALANEAIGADIVAVTNLTEINVQGSATQNIGGLIGSASASTAFIYCQNYGVINATCSTTTEGGISIGGLAGNLANSTIDYSFNAGSITNGYGSSNGMVGTVGEFYVGGLAGKADTSTIENSYNSGMLKAGNKSNTKTAYAGGLLAYGKTTTITNCYNQGSVEALGDNPTFAWKWENDFTHNGNRVTKLSLTLTQTNARNVWAYGIGYLESGSVAESMVKIPDTTSNANNYNGEKSNASIYNNGAINGNGTVLDYWDWESEILPTITVHSTIEQTAVKSDTYIIPVPMPWPPYVIPVPIYNYTYTWFQYKVDPITPTTSDTPNVVVTMVDELEIPTAFVLETKTKVTCDYNRGEWEGAGISLSGVLGAKWWKGKMSEKDDYIYHSISEHYTYNYQKAQSGAYSRKASSEENYSKVFDSVNKKFVGGIAFAEGNSISSGVNGNTIMKNTRSEMNGDERSEIKIAGTEYYLADKDNLTTVFNAGVYEYKNKYSSSILPYFANTDYYTISATFKGSTENIGAKINSVRKTASGIEFDYTVYSTAPLTGGELAISVSVNYTENVTIDTSSINFIYTNEYSLGIRRISGITEASKITTGYTIYSTAGSDGTYNSSPLKYTAGVDGVSIIKLSKTKFEDGYNPSDDDEELVYLVADGNKYVYIPKAKLHPTENGDNYNADLDINRMSFNTLGAESTFTNRVNQIKALFNNKTMYARTASEDSYFVPISFGKGGEITIEFNGSNSKTVGTTLNYGKTMSISKTTTYAQSADASDKYYQVSFTNPTEDVIAVDATDLAIFGYDQSANQWKLGTTSITIGGVAMNVSVEGNKLVFRSETFTAEDATVKNAINSYISSLTFVANDHKTITYADNFAGMESGPLSQTTDAGRLTLNLTVDKQWQITKGASQATISGGNVTFDTSKNITDLPSMYALSGIVVAYGSLQVSATQSYTSSITSYTIATNTLAQVKVGLYYGSNSTAEEEFETVIHGEHLNPSLNASKWSNLPSGTIRVQAKVSGVYKITADDKEVFHIVAKDSANTYYIEGSWGKNSDGAFITAIRGISQIVKVGSSGNNYVWVTQSITEGYNEDGTLASYLVSYTVGGNAILSISYTASGISASNIVSVTLYEHTKGENNTVYVEAKSGDYREQWLNGNITSIEFIYDGVECSISKAKIDALTPITTYQNSVRFYQSGEVQYLVLDYKLTDIGTTTLTFDGEEYPYQTEIERNLYTWDTCIFPNSPTEASVNLSFSKDDWNKMNINYGSAKYIYEDSENLKIYSILAEGTSGGNDDRIQVSVTVKDANKIGATAKETPNVSDTVEPKSIILTTDISFKDYMTGFTKAETVNIVGNGYYISYFGDSFYNQVIGDTFIRDISFLGETYNRSLFVANEISNTDLFNVNLYGSVSALEDTQEATSKVALIADADTTNGEYTITNLTTYASVQSLEKEGVVLFNVTSMTESTNKGVITAIDGVNGEKGADGIDDGANTANRDGKAGVAGTNGAGIKVSLSADNLGFTNEGILYAGQGGNGGAGGSGYRGTDKLNNNGNNNTYGKAGSGALAGTNGEVVGFNGDVYTTTGTAYSGTNGAKARQGFGYLYTTSNDAFIGIGSDYCIKVVKYNNTDESTYSRLGNSTFVDSYTKDGELDNIAHVYNYMFGLSGGYETQFPKDVWGN